MKKPFEQDEYDECDAPAKEAVSNYLESLGHQVIRKDEDYRCDIIAHIPIRHETEVKKDWTGLWPAAWKTVHVPERKKVLLTQAKSAIMFWVVSKDYTKAWRIPGFELTKDRLGELPNKKVAAGELFYKVPIEFCTKIFLKKGGQ